MAQVAIPIVALTLASMANCGGPRHMPPPPTACGLERIPALPGKQHTPELEAQVRDAVGARDIRWITPGMAVTEDYREDRLNIRVSENGRVTSVTCG